MRTRLDVTLMKEQPKAFPALHASPSLRKDRKTHQITVSCIWSHEPCLIHESVVLFDLMVDCAVVFVLAS